MSHKKAKALRKEQKGEAKDFEIRRKVMLEGVKKLGEKYRIDIVGTLQYTQQGIIPMVSFVDVKDQYEHLTPEAKLANKKKVNGELKKKLIV